MKGTTLLYDGEDEEYELIS